MFSRQSELGFSAIAVQFSVVLSTIIRYCLAHANLLYNNGRSGDCLSWWWAGVFPREWGRRGPRPHQPAAGQPHTSQQRTWTQHTPIANKMNKINQSNIPVTSSFVAKNILTLLFIWLKLNMNQVIGLFSPSFDKIITVKIILIAFKFLLHILLTTHGTRYRTDYD